MSDYSSLNNKIYLVKVIMTQLYKFVELRRFQYGVSATNFGRENYIAFIFDDLKND